MGLICLPVIILVLLGLVARSLGVFQEWNIEGVAIGMPLLLPLRVRRRRGALFGRVVLWALVFAVVSLSLGFFSYLYSFDR